MLVSVVIPVYNCISFLSATVRQILQSGLGDFEILLIDDGSTDGTAQVCDELTRRHTNVRCIHQCNSGVSAARNLGIGESRGEYIWFFDADDGVDAGAICSAEQIIRRHRPDMLIFGMSFDYYTGADCTAGRNWRIRRKASEALISWQKSLKIFFNIMHCLRYGTN